MRDDPMHWASAYDFGIAKNQYEPEYHTDLEIYSYMSDFENRYPGVAQFEGGDDYISMTIHSVKISHEVGSGSLLDFSLHFMGRGYLFNINPSRN